MSRTRLPAAERARKSVLTTIRDSGCPDGGGVATERVLQLASGHGTQSTRADAVRALEDLAQEDRIWEANGRWREVQGR